MLQHSLVNNKIEYEAKRRETEKSLRREKRNDVKAKLIEKKPKISSKTVSKLNEDIIHK